MSDIPTIHWTVEMLAVKICSLEQKVREQDARNLERFAAKDALTVATNNAADRAILKSAAEAKELRDEFGKTYHSFLPRTEYQIQHDTIAKQIAINTNRLTMLESAIAAKKEGIGLIGALVLGAFAVLSALVSMLTLWVHINPR